MTILEFLRKRKKTSKTLIDIFSEFLKELYIANGDNDANGIHITITMPEKVIEKFSSLFEKVPKYSKSNNMLSKDGQVFICACGTIVLIKHHD